MYFSQEVGWQHWCKTICSPFEKKKPPSFDEGRAKASMFTAFFFFFCFMLPFKLITRSKDRLPRVTGTLLQGYPPCTEVRATSPNTTSRHTPWIICLQFCIFSAQGGDSLFCPYLHAPSCANQKINLNRRRKIMSAAPEEGETFEGRVAAAVGISQSKWANMTIEMRVILNSFDTGCGWLLLQP